MLGRHHSRLLLLPLPQAGGGRGEGAAITVLAALALYACSTPSTNADAGRDARTIMPSDSGSRDAFIATTDSSTPQEDAGHSVEMMPIIVGAGSNHARFL